MSVIGKNKRALAVSFVIALLVAFAVPTGVQRAYCLGIVGLPDVVGEMGYEAYGFGLPAGCVRFGVYRYGPLKPPVAPVRLRPATYTVPTPFSVQYAVYLAQGYQPLGDTPPLRDAIRAGIRATGREPESEPAGFSVDRGALVPCAICALVVTGIAFAWFLAVRAWTWQPERTRVSNTARLVRLAVAPCLVASWFAWVDWSVVRGILPRTPSLLPPELVVVGTIFIASLGLVVLLTRREWQRAVASVRY